MGFGSVIIGLVGEYLARERLQHAGWRTALENWKGGATPYLDLISTSPTESISIEVQVKTTTKASGGISWQKPGRATVDLWIEQAAARCRLAVVVMIHGDETSVSLEPDEARGGFFVPTPKVLQMTAITAEAFGDLVDERRAEYGTRRRQRTYRGRGIIGEPLSPDQLQIPIYVDDGTPIEDFLSELGADRDADD
jgi:Holliday junction resolvase-like predicted endonuclease